MPFTTQLDSVDKIEPKTVCSQKIGSSLRHSGWATGHDILDKESKKKLLQEYKQNLLYLSPREKLSMSQNFSSLAQIV